MRFNMNKNFERFQETLQNKRRMKALNSMEILFAND